MIHIDNIVLCTDQAVHFGKKLLAWRILISNENGIIKKIEMFIWLTFLQK